MDQTTLGHGIPSSHRAHLREVGHHRIPGYKLLRATLAQLSRAYLAFHGPYSLAPRRAEQMKYKMVHKIHMMPADGSVTIGNIVWNDAAHDVFMFRRLNNILWPTAFRLGEIVGNGSGDVCYLTKSAVSRFFNGFFYSEMSPTQLRNMVPLRMDSASPHRRPNRTN